MMLTENNQTKIGLKIFGHWLLLPFCENLGYSLGLFALMVAMPFVQHFQRGEYVYNIYVAMLFFIMANILSFATGSWGKVSQYLLKPLTILLLIIVFICNYFCFLKFQCLLSADYFQVIQGTNTDEVYEFLQTYLEYKDIFSILILFFLSFIICWFLNSYFSFCRHHLLPKLSLLFWVVSLGSICYNHGVIQTELFDDAKWHFDASECIDLRNHLQHPIIQEVDSLHPSDIVIIIGESFSKNHSSLYNYEKETNPRLSLQKENGNLVVFENVIAPDVITTNVFKYLLNTMTLQDASKGAKWYDAVTLIEAFSCAGYYTQWLSNQKETGIWDNLPSGHAKICDSYSFIDSKHVEYDGCLLDKPYDIEIKKHKKNAIFFHLMGQHENFGHRYPKEFSLYQAADYLSKKKNQREVLSNYDNATLYNDYVVDSIISSFSDKDAVVVYFSDHSLDIFDTDDSFYGHARGTRESKEHCMQIPFMVYVSPSMQHLSPDLLCKLNTMKQCNLCTDQLFFWVLDWCGYKFIRSSAHE